MHLCVCICVRVQVHMYVHACGGQRLTLGVFLNHSPLYFLGQSPSLNLELTGLARLDGQQVPGILLPPPLWCWDWSCTPYTWLSHGCWKLNSSPHAFVAGTLPTEPSLRPLNFFFMFCNMVGKKGSYHKCLLTPLKVLETLGELARLPSWLLPREFNWLSLSGQVA